MNAQDVKNVPGKTDTRDAQWLYQPLECGLLRASFVPPKPIRELRDLTRYRKSLIHHRALVRYAPGFVAELVRGGIAAELGVSSAAAAGAPEPPA